MSEAILQRRIEALERQLDESQQTVRALTSGEIDTLLREQDSTPVLLLAAQEKLLANEQMLRAVFECAMDAMLILDEKGRYIDANPAACVIFGRTREELIGRSSIEFADPSNPISSMRERLRREGRLTGEFQLIRPDGAHRELDFSSVANVLPGVQLSVMRDVTERNAADRALREAELRLRTVIANAPVILFATDRDGIYTLHEGKGVEALGLRAGDLVGKSVFDGRSPAFGADAAFRRALGGEKIRETFRGSQQSFDCTIVPVLHANGAVIGLTGVALDVTALLSAVTSQQASEARYRRIVENTSEGVWMYDPAGKTTFMNRRMAEMLGWPLDSVEGASIFRFMDPAVHEAARARVARRKRGESERGEFQLMRRDGSAVWVAIHADPLFDGDGQFEGSLALVTDVTERRLADEVRNRLAAIVDSSHDAIIGNDLDGLITTWNRGAERLFQWSASEMIGRPVTTLTPPGEVSTKHGLTDPAQRGEVVQEYETSRLRKDGTLVQVALAISAIRDAAGKTVGFSKIARDLTERRKSESKLRQVEEQLRQGQKMEAIGSLAGGIAHDFNNLLSIILTYTELMITDAAPGAPLLGDLGHVKKAAERAARLTKQLLAFSRQQILEPQVLDLNEAARGVKEMLGRLLGEHIQLSLLEGANLGRVFADAGQVEQILMNLVVNARDAIAESGSVTIETANVELDEAYVLEHPGVIPDQYVMLAVSDTGTGMDPKTVSRIFDPFFTTKERGKGTGLGLATVYGIVRQSKGHIWVYSEPGHGTTFKVYFPRTDRLADARQPESQQPTTLNGSETILLVEDEDGVRISARTILQKLGYIVLEAANGEEALAICQEYRAGIQLLLTDVVMPRMTGHRLAELANAERPELKVLYMSGYTEDTIVHHGVLDAGIHYLPKPITPATLAKKVREVLNASLTAFAGEHLIQ